MDRTEAEGFNEPPPLRASRERGASPYHQARNGGRWDFVLSCDRRSCLDMANSPDPCFKAPPRHNCGAAALGEPPRPSHISKMVLSTVKIGPPTYTVDRTVFKLWLGTCEPSEALNPARCDALGQARRVSQRAAPVLGGQHSFRCLTLE